MSQPYWYEEPVPGDATVKAGEAEIPAAVARRAVEWLVELQADEVTDETRQALQRWRRAHPDHERAWQHIESVNRKLKGTASPLGSALTHAVLTTRHSTGRRKAIKSLTVLLFAGGITWSVKENLSWQLADAYTAVGERRTITLAEGTTVALNTDTALDVNFDGRQRRLRLLNGEVLITTADRSAAETRPFIVQTDAGELRPVGTRFNVRETQEGTRLIVLEGTVAIRPQGRPAQVQKIPAGKQVHFTRRSVGAPQPVDDSDTAWTEGVLVARGMRLGDFIAEVDRYRPGRLRCDPAVADLRISGTYPLDDTDQILASVRSALPVDIQTLTRYWVSVGPRR